VKGIFAAVDPTLAQSQKDSQTLFTERFGAMFPTRTRIHPCVGRALKSIPGRLENGHDVSLNTLAVIAGMSPSRFMHVFTESVGVPLRRYILGRRLERAYVELLAGASVTAAAGIAGFSDAAHLTRTFRRILGFTPTELLQDDRAGFKRVFRTGTNDARTNDERCSS
jgi:AraC-like DNA-binding protein